MQPNLATMVSGNKEPGGRLEHGEWVLLEGEEQALRDGVHVKELGARRNGPGLFSIALIIVLLAIIAAASVSVPLLALRPWVGPWSGHEEVLEGLMAGRAMKVRVVLRNSGRTPATNLRVAVRLLIGAPPPAPSPQLDQCAQPGAPLPQSMLFPDATYSTNAATQQEIDDDTVAAVLRSDKTVYLAGCARYEDAILPWLHPGPHQTHFCLMLVPTSAGNNGVLGSFVDCPAGNSVD
jgi:hypothetical protein